MDSGEELEGPFGGISARRSFPHSAQCSLKDVTALEVQKLVYRKRDNGQVRAAIQLRGVIKRMFDYAFGYRPTLRFFATRSPFSWKVCQLRECLILRGQSQGEVTSRSKVITLIGPSYSHSRSTSSMLIPTWMEKANADA
jgi:hypothetical protein